MIRTDEVFYIGKVSKNRGIKGEVEIFFTDDVFDSGTAEYFVLEMDGILVPFFWEEYRFKGSETIIVKFEDINDETASKALVGKRVFYPKRCVPNDADSNELASWKAFTGYTVKDAHESVIGIVESVDDSSANILFYVRNDEGEEVILPVHEDFVFDYSVTDRTLILALPDGLLTLNN